MLMRRTLQITSWLALAGTIAPAIVFLAGATTLGSMKTCMFVAALAWFVATPLWMGCKK